MFVGRLSTSCLQQQERRGMSTLGGVSTTQDQWHQVWLQQKCSPSKAVDTKTLREERKYCSKPDQRHACNKAQQPIACTRGGPTVHNHKKHSTSIQAVPHPKSTNLSPSMRTKGIALLILAILAILMAPTKLKKFRCLFNSTSSESQMFGNVQIRLSPCCFIAMRW